MGEQLGGRGGGGRRENIGILLTQKILWDLVGVKNTMSVKWKMVITYLGARKQDAQDISRDSSACCHDMSKGDVTQDLQDINPCSKDKHLRRKMNASSIPCSGAPIWCYYLYPNVSYITQFNKSHSKSRNCFPGVLVWEPTTLVKGHLENKDDCRLCVVWELERAPSPVLRQWWWEVWVSRCTI